MRAALREAIEAVALAGFIYLLLQSTVVNFQVQGISMLPSLEDTDRVLVNKVVYSTVNMERVSRFLPWVDREEPWFPFHAPERGDVIVFRFPGNPDENSVKQKKQEEQNFVKRVIGVPGDTVEIRERLVYVNGVPLDEPHVSTCFGQWCDVTVGDNQYYVLGDNREQSDDSRSWGMVPEEDIIGRVWLSYWPPGHFGLLFSGEGW